MLDRRPRWGRVVWICLVGVALSTGIALWALFATSTGPAPRRLEIVPGPTTTVSSTAVVRATVTARPSARPSAAPTPTPGPTRTRTVVRPAATRTATATRTIRATVTRTHKPPHTGPPARSPSAPGLVCGLLHIVGLCQPSGG